MPRTYSSIDKIRAELAWVNETPNNAAVAISGAARKLPPAGSLRWCYATKFWTFRWEYYCLTCREYGWCECSARQNRYVKHKIMLSGAWPFVTYRHVRIASHLA